MSTTQQPEALRDGACAMHSARWYMVNRDGMATLCADREDAEKEAKAADMDWPRSGPHRAVQLVDAQAATAELRRLHDENEALRAGYDAARLEIESLRARSVEPAGEYPALPEQVAWRDSVEHCDLYWRPAVQEHNDLEPLYTDKQMRAYVDADRAMRAAQPAPQQAAQEGK